MPRIDPRALRMRGFSCYASSCAPRRVIIAPDGDDFWTVLFSYIVYVNVQKWHFVLLKRNYALQRILIVVNWFVNTGKGKKLTLCLCLTKDHAMKMYWGSGGIAPRIFDLSTRWRWVVSFTTRPLYPQRKNPRYPLDRRLGGPRSRSGCSGEEKNSQPPPGIEPLEPRY
jgi:hypothetical protein